MPAHIILCGANRIRWITICTLIGITHREYLQSMVKQLKKCHLADVRNVLYLLPLSACVRIWPYPPRPRLCGRPLWTAPFLVIDLLKGFQPYCLNTIYPYTHTDMLFSRFYTLLSTLVTGKYYIGLSHLFVLNSSLHSLSSCTFSFITAHFVHHCTLKQALTLTSPR